MYLVTSPSSDNNLVKIPIPLLKPQLEKPLATTPMRCALIPFLVLAHLTNGPPLSPLHIAVPPTATFGSDCDFLLV